VFYYLSACYMPDFHIYTLIIKFNSIQYVEKIRSPHWELLRITISGLLHANDEEGRNWLEIDDYRYLKLLETLKSASASFDNVGQRSALLGM